MMTSHRPHLLYLMSSARACCCATPGWSSPGSCSTGMAMHMHQQPSKHCQALITVPPGLNRSPGEEGSPGGRLCRILIHASAGTPLTSSWEPRVLLPAPSASPGAPGGSHAGCQGALRPCCKQRSSAPCHRAPQPEEGTVLSWLVWILAACRAHSSRIPCSSPQQQPQQQQHPLPTTRGPSQRQVQHGAAKGQLALLNQRQPGRPRHHPHLTDVRLPLAQTRLHA